MENKVIILQNLKNQDKNAKDKSFLGSVTLKGVNKPCNGTNSYDASFEQSQGSKGSSQEGVEE